MRITEGITSLIISAIMIAGCSQQGKKGSTMENTEGANRLINSTSPYLLQHAYNPVEWYPWGDEALKRAKDEDKLILVSIGYSSCHWCHVMERESFENDSIADIMNENFINIKVDREERPDIDQVYMEAVQAMGINGGWPLNVFLTPDQKPFYGGTYFPPETWSRILRSLTASFKDKRDEIEKAANSVTDNLSMSELEKFGLLVDETPFKLDQMDSIALSFAARFDRKDGGMQKAPKFPMPSDWDFLLSAYSATGHRELLDHTLFTLDKMAAGGIYDHLAGGFARYSVDTRWFAPHFEKMLYDNGQLMSLYSKAYKITLKENYKQVVYQTVTWLKGEMTGEDGGFYSAIDADSEGEEGKFYVWTTPALQEFLGDDYDWYSRLYGIRPAGNWENGVNILHRTAELEEFARDNNMDLAELSAMLEEINGNLLNIRNNRERPGTDTKVLTGWNSMMIIGLLDAYDAFADRGFLDLALENAEFLLSNMYQEGKLLRSHKDGVSNIDGYLEDYAWFIAAALKLYQATFDEKWLSIAERSMDHCIENFLDEEDDLFFFTSDKSEKLIARKKELFDNVIPASNSQMARDLHNLGILLDNSTYLDLSEKMLRQVLNLVKKEPAYMSNWASLFLSKADPTAEVVIVGNEVLNFRGAIAREFIPNKLLMGTKEKSELPLFEGREAHGDETTVYVCYNKTCKLPVQTVEEAIAQLNE